MHSIKVMVEMAGVEPKHFQTLIKCPFERVYFVFFIKL